MVHHGNLVAEDLNRFEILDSEPRTVHVGWEIDPQIGAGGDHDKVQFTPNSEHMNSELVSVAKKSQQAEECNVLNDMAYFPPSSSRQSSLFFTLATTIACMEHFMFHAVTERKFFLKTLLKTTRMLKCLFRALWV